MDKFVTDQAEGLRRLLARDGPQVIAVTGGAGSPGRTTTVVNLAAALTGLGKQVLVIDECGGERSASAMPTGAVHAGTHIERVEAVLRDTLPLAEAIERHPPGYGVLCVPRALGARIAGDAFAKLWHHSADVVLIDAQLGDDGALSPLALNAHDVLLVARTDSQGVTATYACIKRLHFAHAIGQFRVVVNHVQNAAEARIVLDNLVGVASRYLAVALECAGYVAADPHMARAVELARPIVDAFPSTLAARDFRSVADEVQHWPLRPALAACAAASADPHAAAQAARITEVSAVSTVTGMAEGDAPTEGWPTGPSERRRPMHHA
ncbi:MAG TPA: MinD/ParA family protein [Paraburkholderia sp.]|nr:MinD/ParA family protein [Paraburkholderia sp.]